MDLESAEVSEGCFAAFWVSVHGLVLMIIGVIVWVVVHFISKWW
jgi:hypothetical protein